MLVRHTCDTPLCVNPEHLVLGTNADNMRDMKDRKRGIGPGLGEKHPRAILTLEVVRLIREASETGETIPKIAERFELTKQHVYKIVKRIIWNHC